MGVLSLALRTGVAQLGVQALGFAGGILVVRLLPVGEYAIYTLLMAALGTLTVLADAGLTNAVLAQAGRVHGDAERVNRVVHTGLVCRRRFSLIVACVAAPALFVLLQQQGLPLVAALLGVVAVGLAFVPVVVSEVLQVPLRLEQAIMPLQRLQLLGNGLRVGLLGVALWALPSAALALLCAALSQWWINARLRYLVPPLPDRSSPIDVETAAHINRAVRRTLPGALYHCVAAHLPIWLLAVLGSSTSVAEVGALGRLAVIFSVLQATVSLIVLPRFARLPAERPRLLRFFWKANVLLSLLGTGLVLAAAWLPAPLLWLLGPSYASLTDEVALMAANGALALLAGSGYALNAARGYLPPASLPVLLGLTQMALLVALLDVSTVHGVLWLQIGLSVFGVVFWALVFAVHARREAAPR